MTKSKSAAADTRERGGWLSAWLILIGIQSVVYSFLILYLRGQRSDPSPAWVLLVLIALSLANIVAIIAIWKWKKWGLQLYAVLTAIGIAVGLMLTGSQLVVFHDIIFLVILGFLVKDKWSYFE